MAAGKTFHYYVRPEYAETQSRSIKRLRQTKLVAGAIRFGGGYKTVAKADTDLLYLEMFIGQIDSIVQNCPDPRSFAAFQESDTVFPCFYEIEASQADSKWSALLYRPGDGDDCYVVALLHRDRRSEALTIAFETASRNG